MTTQRKTSLTVALYAKAKTAITCGKQQAGSTVLVLNIEQKKSNPILQQVFVNNRNQHKPE